MGSIVHYGWRCDGCGIDPIVGWRFRCGNCVDFDLCTACFERSESLHDNEHAFIAFKRPIRAQVATEPLLNCLVYNQNAFSCTPNSSSSFTPSSSSFARVPSIDKFGRLLVNFFLEAHGQQNVVVSPASVIAAMSLTGLGASPATALEFGRGLFGLEDATDMDLVRKTCGEFLAGLSACARHNGFSVANSFWIPPHLSPHLDPVYKQTVSQQFGCEIFCEPLVAARVNNWVKDKTSGAITSLIDGDELLEDADGVLLNAIYFRGLWRFPFDSQLTRESPFYADSSRSRVVGQCRLMRLAGGSKNLSCVDNDQFLGVALPYKDSNLVMRLAVPKPDQSGGAARLTGALELVSCSQFSWTQQSSGETDCAVMLPKLKVEWGAHSVIGALRRAGLSACFQHGQHNFPGITKNSFPLKILEVIHKCVLEIDEEGTVAAAATAVLMAFGGSMPKRPLEIVLDCPFALSIYDPGRDISLFSGIIYILSE